MENQKSAGEVQNSQKKEWYKNWWGIIIAIIILPYFLLYLMWTKTKWNKAVKIILTILVVIITLSAAGENNKIDSQQITNSAEQSATIETKIADEKQQPNKNQQTANAEKDINLANYKIEYEIKNKRYDGGINYYVLIDSVDLTNDKFKNDIKDIVRKMVKEKGTKISIDFVDDKKVLDLEYKSHYGSNTLGRILNKDEMNQLGLHLIAVFSGELEMGLYKNELMFFPATFTDNPKVGKYIESIEFNP